MLRYNQTSRRVEKLGDASFHRIFDVLFGIALADQSAYLKAKTATLKTTAANRLSSCAGTLRLAVEVGVRSVRSKSVKALLDHLIETSTLPNQELCEPLVLDYVKCLKALLSYRPHVEHLQRVVWEQIALFCIKHIAIAKRDAGNDVESDLAIRSNEGLAGNGSHKSSRSHARTSGGSQGSRSLTKQIAEELTGCLRLLTNATNAATIGKASDLLWTLIDFLKVSSVTANSGQDVFAAINNVLDRTVTDDIQLTKGATSHLLRLVNHYWSSKSTSLKDEMLVCLAHLRPFISHLIRQDDAPTLRRELSALLETLRSDYTQRLERDQLHLDDLRLELCDVNTRKNGHLHSTLFSLRPLGPKAERNWTVPSFMSFLCDELNDDRNDNASDGEVDDIDPRPQKRLRTPDELGELFDSTLCGTAAARVSALQCASFLGQRRHFTVIQMTRALEDLSQSCSDNNASVSSWAFMAIASLATQQISTASSLASLWASIWQLGIRSMSTGPTCRAACCLLNVMLRLRHASQAHIAELTRILGSSIDLSGPALLSDSAVQLLQTALQVSTNGYPTTASNIAEHTLGWLFRRWTPSKFDERGYMSTISSAGIVDIIRTVAGCVGQRCPDITSQQTPVWHVVGKGLKRAETRDQLLSYLLLLPDRKPPVHSCLLHDGPSVDATETDTTPPRPLAQAIVLSHINNELLGAADTWDRLIRDRPRGLGLEPFAALTSFCVPSTCIAHTFDFVDARGALQLQKCCARLLDAIEAFAASPNCEQDKTDALLSLSAHVLPGLYHDIDQKNIEPNSTEIVIAEAISRVTAARREAGELSDVIGNDMMDDQEQDDSQDSRHGNRPFDDVDLPNVLAADFSIDTMRSSISFYSSILTLQDNTQTSEENTALVSARIVDTILSLPETTLLGTRGVLTNLPRLGIDLTIADTERLLDFLSNHFLGPYEYARSEVALGTIIDLMSSLESTWTDSSNETLFNLGLDMYEWFTSVALTADVLSPDVQERLASLLLQLCQVDINYGAQATESSVRTSLFSLLKVGSMTVQFHLADRISSIFGLFEISTHSAIFDDLQESLPIEMTWTEGIAMRLRVLAQLASSWRSLLRQCVYYIFETAGSITHSKKYATKCMESVATSLGFGTPRKLFPLFGSQLLYTWLDTHPLGELPHEIFDYATLADLLSHNQAEIVGQLFLRGAADGLERMSQALGKSIKVLVAETFGKTFAYAISWDISNPSTAPNMPTCESRLRNAMGGKEQFKNLIRTHYPLALGQFFLSIHQEHPDDRWLEKRETYAAAAQALADMVRYSSSTTLLPKNQQPHFRVKYLPDQIERLGRRLGFERANHPWDASSFTLAARMLLDTIEDGLGSLHNCAVLRRLRLLIAMAGEVALHGHQLEMILRSLLPFLTDDQCAKDSLGMIHFLYLRGQAYLSENPIFLCGTAVLTLLRLSKHMGGRQESTTQESEHRETVQLMQKFRSWLVNYLQRLQGGIAAETKSEFDELLSAMSHFQLPGNAREGSAETGLLLWLLRQTTVDCPLIRKPDALDAVAILAEHFERPSSPVDDCLGDDDVASKYASSLWCLAHSLELNERFILWASTVVGRAYVATGSKTSFDALDRPFFFTKLSPQSQGHARSQHLIAEQLTLVLQSRKRHESSIGEYTIRACSTTFTDPAGALSFERMLPETLPRTFGDGTYGYIPPGVDVPGTSTMDFRQGLRTVLSIDNEKDLLDWIAGIAVLICQAPSRQPLLKALPVILHSLKFTAVNLLPCIVHLALADELDKDTILQTALSESMLAHFTADSSELEDKQRYLIQLMLYLRSQPYPGEATKVDRSRWLSCDQSLAARCAVRCHMPTTALMLAELARTPAPMNRRASSRASLSRLSTSDISDELLLSVFQQIDEPDSYYGVKQSTSLDSVLSRLDYEGSGFKSLMLRSAQLDSQMKESHHFVRADAMGMVRSLSSLNLNSLTFALASGGISEMAATSEEMLDSARRLQQWDIRVPDSNHGDSATLFKAFKSLSHASEKGIYMQTMQKLIVSHVRDSVCTHALARPSHAWLNVLATLTEVFEVVSSPSLVDILSRWEIMAARVPWMQVSPFETFHTIMHSRQTIFGILADNKNVLSSLYMSAKDARMIETKALLSSSALSRKHDQLQDALAAATQISALAGKASAMGLHVESSAKREVASVLWHAGESAASVEILREVLRSADGSVEDIQVGRAGVLSQMGQQLAEARLENPADILQNYLKPAIAQLQSSTGSEAGKVFYAFASFCDQQLQNPAALEDFNRISKLRQAKLEEVEQLETLLKSSKRSGSDRNQHEHSLKKAQQWFNIDDEEFQRHKRSRDTFMQQSLQNFMRALHASNEHDICVLRFFALWLDNPESRPANEVVVKYLPTVPSWKFVLLMNQLMSRLKHDGSPFQKALMELVYRICREHQYHTVHHLYASRRTASKDEAARLRANAAQHICRQLEADKQKGETLVRMLKADSLYRMLAEEPSDGRRSGRYQLKDSAMAHKLSRHIPQDRVPPATIDLELRPDGHYRDVPVITSFASTIHIMTGLSAPKVLTAVASNGRQYRQLFKGGNDDLRQDAIMEQVFGEVSKMLRNHKATRQRNLHVRTYKVIPLTNRSGIIEFVPNSIPINDFLQPAHLKYHPSSMKPGAAREKIHAVAGQSVEVRVKEFRKACDQMPPVLRHFFFERFDDPDEWFEKRTAYTRTTATVSMLGQVLGLGDRHCHNILLDEKSGEVVHIDLGVAFEAGRVLPIPELVPFRLTRDIVDGMGVTGTEGVFRRCCEFAMDALREDKDSIMTLLNVLRYDPLYTWTLSPLRAKRMQEQEGDTNANDTGAADGGLSKKTEQEAGEADRALSIVEKKLSKTLSTAATVSELIQQARDDKNLATLFNGWAAFF